MNILNVYQINIFQILKLMNKVKHSLSPRAFPDASIEIHHKFPKKYSKSSFE